MVGAGGFRREQQKHEIDRLTVERLALLQNLQDRALALAAEFGGLGGQLLQNLLLAVDLQRRNDGIRRDEIGEQHGPFSEGSGSAAGAGIAKARTISIRRGPVNGRFFSIVGGSIQPIRLSARL